MTPYYMNEKFPDIWPDSCPPPDAQPAQGSFFRVTKGNPPYTDDFKSYAELGKAPYSPPCLRVGLSLLKNLDDAIHQIKLFPKTGKFVFNADLEPQHGKCKQTKGTLPSHTTWWPFEGVDRAALFHFEKTT